MENVTLGMVWKELQSSLESFDCAAFIPAQET